jgi:FtsH-binding integral membrane protein
MNSGEYLAETPYARFGSDLAIDAPVDARRTFIRRTYAHLTTAIYAFVLLEWLFFYFHFDQWMMRFFQGTPMAGLVMLGAFLLTSYLANSWARSDTSVNLQYAGLLLYVLAEAVIFVPILMIAQGYAVKVGAIGDVSIIAVAAITTLLMFAALSASVFFTRKDFSFLQTGLWIGGAAAMALIVVSYFAGGLHLGTWFSAAMIVLACGWILYDTSNVLHHYRTDQHVAASLALFASVALLFWYVLRLLMELNRRN